jgi:anti-sigma regulatory factor (Ser/Thr protein kinase)
MPQILDLAFDSGTLRALRAAVQERAGQAGMPEDRVVEVVLAVHELAANAVRHGAGAGRLRIWNLSGALHCQVEDGGAAACDGRKVRAGPWPYVDGHGLWVVRQVADDMEVLSDAKGTRATVTFALPAGPLSASTKAGRLALIVRRREPALSGRRAHTGKDGTCPRRAPALPAHQSLQRPACAAGRAVRRGRPGNSRQVWPRPGC